MPFAHAVPIKACKERMRLDLICTIASQSPVGIDDQELRVHENEARNCTQTNINRSMDGRLD
jgi:hypothetical protein